MSRVRTAEAATMTGLDCRTFTVAALADHWQVTTTTIYNLIDRGELRAWRLGGKLWRINADAVGEYECQNTASGGSPESAPMAPATGIMSCTTPMVTDRTVSRLARMTARQPRLSVVTSGRGAPSQTSKA
jgi:excisionase family DNA binding protein